MEAEGLQNDLPCVSHPRNGRDFPGLAWGSCHGLQGQINQEQPCANQFGIQRNHIVFAGQGTGLTNTETIVTDSGQTAMELQEERRVVFTRGFP